MPASPTFVRVLENDRQFLACSLAVRHELLNRVGDDEEVRLAGVAHVGDEIGYYVVTHRGIHYTDRQKAGLFKKRDIAGFIDRLDLDHVYVERFPNLPRYAYLRLEGKDRRVGSVWFEDQLGDRPAEVQARDMAAALHVE